jgi:transposase
VKPFVKRQKNDAAEAEAIAEAASRPTMRFVAVKTKAQQARMMTFRARDLLVRQRRQLVNAARAAIWRNTASWRRRGCRISSGCRRR